VRALLRRSDGFCTNEGTRPQTLLGVNKAMSAYSIAMLRCPLFFERWKFNSICYLRGLSMQNVDF
jgi:hypothetical protein